MQGASPLLTCPCPVTGLPHAYSGVPSLFLYTRLPTPIAWVVVVALQPALSCVCSTAQHCCCKCCSLCCKCCAVLHICIIACTTHSVWLNFCNVALCNVRKRAVVDVAPQPACSCVQQHTCMCCTAHKYCTAYSAQNGLHFCSVILAAVRRIPLRLEAFGSRGFGDRLLCRIGPAGQGLHAVAHLADG